MLGDREWSRSETLRALALVFVAAVAFRSALLVSGLLDVVYETADSWQYFDLAHSILRGSFAEAGAPSMNRTPGYPAFLAAIYWLFGDGRRVVIAAQIVLDSATAVMTAHLAIRLRLRESAVAAVSAMAVTCLYTSSFALQAMTETLYTFALTASLWALVDSSPDGVRLSHRTTTARVVWSGALLGFGTLVRPALAPSALLYLVLLLAGLVLMQARAGGIDWRIMRTPALFSAGLLVVVVPWMIRNYVVFHDEFVGPNRAEVTLLGRKCSIPNNGHFYTKQFQRLLSSYEEPYIQIGPFDPPTMARYVYPGEREELMLALRSVGNDFQTSGHFGPSALAAFDTIADKRYRAAARLYVTAPLTKMGKVWVTPRASVLWWNRSGASLPRWLLVLLTGYNLLYVLLGFAGIGLAWGRARASVVPLFAAAMVLGHTWVYAIWLPFPLPRYAVALFPLLCLGAGVVVERAAMAIESPRGPSQ